MIFSVSLSSNSDETTGLSASHQGSQLDLPIMNLNALSKHPMVSNDVESSQSVQSIRRMTLPRNMKFNLPLVHFCNTPDQLKFHQADSSSKVSYYLLSTHGQRFLVWEGLRLGF